MGDGCWRLDEGSWWLVVGGWRSVVTANRQLPTANRLDGQLRANDSGKPRCFRRRREPHNAAQIVVVGERQRRHSQFHRTFHEALRVGSAVEQGERGMAVQFGVHGPGAGWSWRGATRAPDRASQT